MKRLLAIIITAALLAGLSGSVVLAQPEPGVWVRETYEGPTPIVLTEAGWSDPTAGEWDPDARTATLIADLTAPVEIQIDDATLDGNGHTVSSSGSGNGLTLSGRMNITIKNLTVSGFDNGFYVSGSTPITLDGNTATGNHYGFYLCNSATDNTLTGNTATGNDYGFYLSEAAGTQMRDNVASENAYQGIHIESSSLHTLEGNTADRNGEDGIQLTGSHFATLTGNTANGNQQYGLRIEGSTSDTLSGNTLSQNRFNFRLDGSAATDYKHSIDGTNLADGKPILYVRGATSGSYDGSSNAATIYLINCSGITVSGLTLTNNDTGILLWGTSNTTIEDVQANGNSTGIRLRNSSNNTLRNNVCRSNANHGIWLEAAGGGASTGNTLEGNTAGTNGQYGYLLDGASNNLLKGNTSSDNGHGVYLRSASSNRLYNNRFVSNKKAQAYVTGGSGNSFNEPSPTGGNYWSDWTGPDADNDGFVDDPYVFSGGQDNLPFATDGSWNDRIAPTTSIEFSGDSGSNGWFRSDVQVTLTAVDNPDGSGVASTSYSFDGDHWNNYTGPFTIGDEGLTTVYYRSVDKAGNVEEPGTEAVRIDRTPPTVTFGAADPAPNAAGWNNTDVSVPYTAQDGVSGVWTSDPANPLVLTQEGQAVSGQVTVTDVAGNSTTVSSPAFMIDKTPPTVVGRPLSEATAYGWYNADVTVHWDVEDNLSGVDQTTLPADEVVSGEGAGLSAGPVTVWDLAGNEATASLEDINIDRTPPTLTFGVPEPAANKAGWNNTDVSVPYTASDDLSGLAPDSPASPLVLTEEGQDVSAVVTVTDQAGNSTSLPSPTANIDKTAPTMVATAATAQGEYTAGVWTQGDVTVSFECRDNLSGVVSTPKPVLVNTEGRDQSATGTCSDAAGNVAEATFEPINIDRTRPKLIGYVTPDPNAAGWNNTDVTVVFEATDPLSGLASVPSPTSITQEGTGMAVQGIAIDRAGNRATALVENINIDKTAPAIAASAATASGPYAPDTWTQEDVTVSFECTDELSGLAITAEPVLVDGEGQGQTVTGECTDVAGNSASVTYGTINIDRTPPTLVGRVDPAPNAAGWNNTDVTVVFEAADELSGLAAMPAPVPVAMEGAGMTVQGNAVDQAGNEVTASVVLNIDKTPPQPVITTPQPGGNLTVETPLEFGGEDDLSGVASVVGSADDGQKVTQVSSGDLLREGVYVLTVTVTDTAGNSGSESRSFAVVQPSGYAAGSGTYAEGAASTMTAGKPKGKPKAQVVVPLASFSFTCRYQRGEAVPSSHWSFYLEASDVSFQSTSYDWLLVQGGEARFAGHGTLNGQGGYGFMATAVDGQQSADGMDRLRVRIWDEATGEVVYDSEPGTDPFATPSGALEKGRITIHE